MLVLSSIVTRTSSLLPRLTCFLDGAHNCAPLVPPARFRITTQTTLRAVHELISGNAAAGRVNGVRTALRAAAARPAVLAERVTVLAPAAPVDETLQVEVLDDLAGPVLRPRHRLLPPP